MVKPRRLFVFPTSPFSRRVRLALAHKRLEAEVLDARAEPKQLEEARRISPQRTMPVLEEPDGRVLGDSTAILHYLDRAYPEAPLLWPSRAPDAHTALEVTSLVDLGLNTLVDLGTRYYALRHDPAWPSVKDEMLARVVRAFAALEERAKTRDNRTITDAGWCAADMILYTAVVWIEGWPGRVSASPLVAQLFSLGYALPPGLSRWADPHRARPDVRALG
jgi:glutathione S-transferase